MEEEDEFGDIYTDVLRPLTTSSSAASASSSQQKPSFPPPQSSTAPPDVNINSDDEEILYGTSNPRKIPDSNTHHLSSRRNQTLVLSVEGPDSASIVNRSPDSHRNLNLQVNKDLGSAGGGVNLEAPDSAARVLKMSGGVEEAKKGFEDPNFMEESGLDIDVAVEDRDDKDDNLLGRRANFEDLMGRNENFDAEDADDTGVREPLIPGLSIAGVSSAVDNNQGDPNLEDDWDSDSEDDLQIVLNDNDHGPMALDRGAMMGMEDDDDEDGEPLVIVADGENPNHQPIMDEQEWGEDVAQGVDGEKKELGDGAKVNGGAAVAPRIGYSGHGYHPYHSQFKYVRPGAAPMPGAPLGTGGAPGQVRPPTSVGPMVGRGRGDWRPTGIKNAPGMQRSFHPGYGVPVWGSNAGRGFGSGLEFTLPSHKTIFEVDVDSFDEKPWRHQGIDISDYFNFGLNEESWKDYCKQLEQLRLEATMQSRIRVYESGRTEQEYDPDLPPELAAAAAGIHDISSENANVAKAEPGQSDLTKGSAHLRPPLPTGRAIQVEMGYGERLPSIDTRPPRFRDSDAIIEIVPLDSADDAAYAGDDQADQPENGPSGQVLVGEGEIEEDIAQEEAEHYSSQHAYDGRKREFEGGRAAFVNSVHESVTDGDRMPLPSEAPAPLEYHSDFGAQTPPYHSSTPGIPHEERLTKGRALVRSPDKTPSEDTRDKIFLDSQKEESVESVGGKQQPEHDDSTHEDLVLDDGSPEGGSDHNTTIVNDNIKYEKPIHSKKKQKLDFQAEQPSSQDIDDAEDSKAARSSDNSKARSGSCKEYRKLGDGVDDEVMQDGHSTRTGKIKRPLSEDGHNTWRKGRDERQEMERPPRDTNAREDSNSRKNWDPYVVHHSHLNMHSIDKRRASDHSGAAFSRRDGDPHGRRAGAEGAGKLERGDELGSRRPKLRESDRSDKDEHQLRKHMENGSWRAHHDKDTGSLHRDKEDIMKSRNESMDDVRIKRRKEDAQFRRDHAEKELLHASRESTRRRKQERDEALDQRKRDDQGRIRDDDQHSVRHKAEGWYQRDRSERQRERDDWLRHKQSQEESLSKREREDGRRIVRTGQAGEDKAWASHSSVKDDYRSSDRDSHLKDTGRHSEHLKRKDRVENESVSQPGGRDDVYGRGNLGNNDDRRARPERASTRADRGVSVADNRGHEKKHKENTRKTKESEGVDRNSSTSSKRNQEDLSGQINEMVTLKGKTEQRSGEHDVSVNHQSSRKPREFASSDDEQQDAKRGRSKLERWTSHEERNFSISTKSSSSLKIKEIDKHNIVGAIGSKVSDESSKTGETVEATEKDSNEPDNKNGDTGPVEDRHLDTVAKLKKRSERFKLPMPSEKEAMTVKKVENESLHSAEIHADSEIKGRPARKRRWTSN